MQPGGDDERQRWDGEGPGRTDDRTGPCAGYGYSEPRPAIILTAVIPGEINSAVAVLGAWSSSIEHSSSKYIGYIRYKLRFGIIVNKVLDICSYASPSVRHMGFLHVLTPFRDANVIWPSFEDFFVIFLLV